MLEKNKIDISKDLSFYKKCEFDISDLSMTMPEVLFGILQCNFLHEKRIVNYSYTYYADGMGTDRWSGITDRQTAYRQCFCDYKAFAPKLMDVVGDVGANTYYYYILGKIDEVDIQITHRNPGNTLEISSNSAEEISLPKISRLVDFIKSMTTEILNIHRVEPFCGEYIEFANLLREVGGFDMKNMLNHINAAYVMHGIPEEYVRRNKTEEWNEFTTKRHKKFQLWKKLAKEKNLNELSWQIMNDVYEQSYYDLRLLNTADRPMLEFLMARNKKLYEQGQLNNFIILNKNDKKFAPNWIFALYSDLVNDN
jgi:hypothetical protein